jgi:hypothetical protein
VCVEAEGAAVVGWSGPWANFVPSTLEELELKWYGDAEGGDAGLGAALPLMVQRSGASLRVLKVRACRKGAWEEGCDGCWSEARMPSATTQWDRVALELPLGWIAG